MSYNKNRCTNSVSGKRSRLLFRLRHLPAGIRAAITGVVAVTAAFSIPVAQAELPVVLKDNAGKVVRFQGANLPGQPYVNPLGGQTLEIDQFSDRAILHWESFNISKDNEVKFNQPRNSSIALNRILGDANLPSFIDGHLSANGRIFIINQNGILFGKNARVDTRSFVASTLDIDDDLYEQVGFENAINEDGSLAAFDSFGQPMGEITIEAGASIQSAKNGRILVFAPSITNEGNLESPEGQIVLAAAEDRVYLASADEDDDTRGLLVGVSTGGDVTNLGSLIAERGNVSLLGMAVNQEGLARATTSVSLNGTVKLVAQDMNGGLAKLGTETTGFRPVGARAGELTLGEASVTEVLPDATDEATAPDAQLQKLSSVTLQGEQVLLKSGAVVTATGGDVVIEANASPQDAEFDIPLNPEGSAESIVIESGAVVDVSGYDQTEVSVARNFVEVEARGNELADAPLQRDGAIRNKTLTVDIRGDSTLLNLDGARASVERAVGERLSTGGTIALRSKGQVSVAEGATLDISGGQVSYTGAEVSTSQLVTRDGNIVDIAEADPDLLYSGVLGDLEINHEKWGVNETFRSSFDSFEPGYTEGKDAGELRLVAPGLSFEGNLVATAEAGQYQRNSPGSNGGELSAGTLTRPFDQVPLGGKLVIQKLNRDLQDLVIGSNTEPLPYENGHPESASEAFVMSPDVISGSGVSRIDVDNAGRIIVNSDLELPAFGELALLGTQVLVQSDITVPGGSVAFEAIAGGESAASTSLGKLGDLDSVLADSASTLVDVSGTVDVSGSWSNDSTAVNGEIPGTPIITDGGSVLLLSGRDVRVGADSVLNAGGGAHLTEDGKLQGGQGGDISLRTWTSEEKAFASTLDIQGELRSFGMDGGGALSLAADVIRVDAVGEAGEGDYALEGTRQFSSEPDDSGTQNVLTVRQDTFQRGGFQSYALEAVRADLEVAPGATVTPTAATPLLDALGILAAQDRIPAVGSSNGHPLEAIPAGVALTDFTRETVLPAFNRQAVDVDLQAGADGRLTVGEGAAIVAETGARISLTAPSDILIDGSIVAPAGVIDVQLQGGSGIVQDRIWLGQHAQLSADGAVAINPVSNTGLLAGDVLDAGRVSIVAEQGSVIAEAGAHISVDAAAAELDLGTAGTQSRQLVAGEAGEILLSAAESLVYAGSLSGQAAGAGEGGRLAVRLDPNTRGAQIPDPREHDEFYRGEHIALMQDYAGPVPDAGDAIDEQLLGRAYVPVSQLQAGGFDSLNVTVRSSASGGNTPDTPDSLPVIAFTGETRLDLGRSLVLDAPVIRSTATGDVELSAPHIALGSSDTRVRLDGARPVVRFDENGDIENNIDDDALVTMRLDPTPGEGSLLVEAGLLELVGELATQGFGDTGSSTTDDAGVQLHASGDLRMRGVRRVNSDVYDGLFRTASDLEIVANRLYPVTLTRFALSVEGAGGLLDIASAGEDSLPAPLSIGGDLSLAAENIHQGGNVYAPLGQLQLLAGNKLQLADGSLTSTSAVGVEAPFFQTQPGGDLVLTGDEINNRDIIFTDSPDEPFEQALPEQSLVLAGPAVDVQEGAVFDLRGGSEARATEFVPGPGGSRDILLADLDGGEGVIRNPAFAIMPGIGEYAPYDPLETPAAEKVQGIETGDTLVLDEGFEGLPAGEYAILPARYALFGGYLVTPVPKSQDFAADSGIVLPGGSVVLSGRYGVAGSDVADDRTQGFAIANGDIVRSRAEYLETPLADLYDSSKGVTPDDAGTLVIAAQTALNLAGQLVQGGSGTGLGSQVDIIADSLRIGAVADNEPGIQLLASQLETLGADSLLVGGRREGSADGLVIDARAAAIEVAAGVDLELPELILAANRITVDSTEDAPTRLQSTGSNAAETEVLLLEGDAGIIAVSDRSLTLERTSAAGDEAGSISVTPDATLAASGSIIVDVAGDVDVAGSFDAAGALINLGASAITIGETGSQQVVDGLQLSNEKLAALQGSRLRLRTGNFITVAGELVAGESGQDIVLGSLLLDAQGIQGIANDGLTTRMVADEIRLSNTSGLSPVPDSAGPTGGALAFVTNTLTLSGPETGSGRFQVKGYSEVEVEATSAVLVDNDAELYVEAPLAIDAPVISGTTGARGVITVAGADLTVTGADAAAELPAATGLAASLLMQADAIDFGGRVVLPSGNAELFQTGDAGNPVAGNDLAVASGSILDVSGKSFDFGPEQVGTPGGNISLHAQTGNIALGAGSQFNVAGAEEERAGSIHVEAPNGTVTVAADTVFASGEQGGSLVVGARTLTVGETGDGLAYTELNSLLGDGFSERRDVALQDQDLLLDVPAVVRAHQVRAVSDNGSVVIRGTIDASGQGKDTARENGGEILLAAGDSVTVEPSAVLRATGSSGDDGVPLNDTSGGKIRLLALDADGSDPSGQEDRVNLQAGALLDVRGGESTVPPGNLDVDGKLLLATTSVVSIADIEIARSDINDFLTAYESWIEGSIERPADPGELVPGLILSTADTLTLEEIAAARQQVADFLDLHANPLRVAALDRGGSVQVHTRRLDPDSDGVADVVVLGDMDATVTGAAQAEIVATQHVRAADTLGNGVTFDGSTINAAAIAAAQASTAAFVADAPAAEGWTMVPGLLLEADGDLVLSDRWDFNGADAVGGWHFGETETEQGITGHLALRAPGDISLQADLSDAFFDETLSIFVGGNLPDRVTPATASQAQPSSWSYQLVAGADTDSADISATTSGTGDISLDPGVVVRTGTTNIEVAAGGDVHLEDGAAIYTGGYDRGLSQNIRDVRPSFSIFTTEFYFNEWLGEGAIFPVAGGDVSVTAGGAITAAGTQQLPTDWQPRIGEATLEGDPDFPGGELALDEGAVPTHWGIAFHRFAGIGALAGGEVSVEAGGDISNVLLAVPTTGRTVAGAVQDEISSSKFGEALETTEVAGGGILKVSAGGNVDDSTFYIGDGVAEIAVQGGAVAGTNARATSIYAGGDSRLKMTTGGDLDIAAVQDPGAVELSESQGERAGESADYFGNLFFTYQPAMNVTVQTLAGDLDLSGTAGDARALAPGFTAISHSGDLNLHENITQFPSVEGQLELLAGNNLLAMTGVTPIRLQQSDQEAALLPGIQNPHGSLSDAPEHAEIPLHSDDRRVNLLVASEGDISTTGSPFLEVRLAKAVHVEAGRDISNLSAIIQNNHATDITSFVAGRDIVQQTQRDASSGAFSTFKEDSNQISQFEIAGPGQAEFLAGRSIILGTSDGIETVGNSKNRFLPEGGADLVLMAGLGEGPDYEAFIQAYLGGTSGTGTDPEEALIQAVVAGTTETDVTAAFNQAEENEDIPATGTEATAGLADYSQSLEEFLQQRGIEVAVKDPVEIFRSLDRRTQRALLAEILFNELLESGTFAQESATQDYERGFNAIASLFPASDSSAEISMLLSQVQTLDGGDIQMLVPGGLINAGSSNSDIIAKGASELGVVAAKEGDIDVFVDGDLLVNSTRVFALQGDLLVWSSNGSIDAGKGAKTVASVPEPVTRLGPTGETIIEFPPAVEGSGLQGANAFLFAPNGVINAGDAGIRTAGNLTLGATEVLGADNIDVGGVSVGVPVASSSVSGLAGANNVASTASKLAEDSASTLAGNDADGAEDSELGILSVEVVGFGNCPPGDSTCS